VWRLSISNSGRVDVATGADFPGVGNCTSLKT
jgi:hypothetical protein